MEQPDDQGKERKQRAYNLTLASVAGQVGFITLFIIFIALFGGLWLDRYLNTKPFFTILLLISSIPVTIFIMFRVVKAATDRIKPIQRNSSSEEES